MPVTFFFTCRNAVYINAEFNGGIIEICRGRAKKLRLAPLTPKGVLPINVNVIYINTRLGNERRCETGLPDPL